MHPQERASSGAPHVERTIQLSCEVPPACMKCPIYRFYSAGAACTSSAWWWQQVDSCASELLVSIMAQGAKVSVSILVRNLFSPGFAPHVATTGAAGSRTVM